MKYNDENSLACVISLAYYSAVNYYTKIRELPAGRGFADIVYIPKKNIDKPVLVIELKYNHSAAGAIQQIKDKKYVSALQGYSGDILLVGINYDKKSKRHQCVAEKFQFNDSKEDPLPKTAAYLTLPFFTFTKISRKSPSQNFREGESILSSLIFSVRNTSSIKS